MASPSDPPKPSFSISLGPAKPKHPPRKPVSTFTPKRSAAHLDSGDDSDHADDSLIAKVQLVTGFDSAHGGAVDLDDTPREDAGPLVIPKLSNLNWREEAEQRRGGKKAIYLPPEALAKQQGRGINPEDLVETDKIEQKYGLQVFERTVEEPVLEPTVSVDADAPPPPPQTEEEVALSALLRGDAPGPSTLVLAPTAASNGNDWRAARAAVANEDAAFKTDVASRPEMATLEDYAAVPVEEFGAALLRGMGWKEGGEVGKRRGAAAAKPRVVEKRPAFLGIGAKAKEEVLELGTWGKGDKRRKRHDTTYVPVVMVDKKTGRIVDPAEAEVAAVAAANGKEKVGRSEGSGRTERGDRDKDRDEPPRRERSRDRGRDRFELPRRERSKDRDRDRDELPRRERSRDRDRDRRDRRDHERSYDSSDRRRRDRDRGKDRSRERGKDRDRERRREDDDRDRRRGDDDRDRRRGDDRRRDDRQDRDRDRRDRR